MNEAKNLIPIRPCTKCKKLNTKVVSMRPLGRKQDVYRIECECGNGPSQWSVSEGAAIRLWNAHGAN